MAFKVVSPLKDDDRTDAVLRGVANGCNDLFPLPAHPWEAKDSKQLGVASCARDSRNTGIVGKLIREAVNKA